MIQSIILAGGASSRMGECKALLPYRGSCFLEQLVVKLLPISDRVIIVTGAHHQQIHQYAQESGMLHSPKLLMVENKDHQLGMLSSLQCGIRNIPDANTWLLYHFVDQPGLPETFYLSFVEQIDNQKHWIQPILEGRHRHPVLLRNTVYEHLLETNPSGNLRDALLPYRHLRTAWEYTGDGNFSDIDTPAEYRTLIE